MVKTFCTFLQNLVHTSIRIIFLSLFIVGGVQSIYAANIIISPANISTRVGQTFTIDILVNDNKDAINAASALLSFPSDVLSITSVSKSGSFINLWAEEPTYSNIAGTASFEGVALNPGFSGATGKAITITFKAKQAGNVSILLKSGSVLANDGNATNVLGTLSGAFVVINETETSTVSDKKVSQDDSGSLPVPARRPAFG